MTFNLSVPTTYVMPNVFPPVVVQMPVAGGFIPFNLNVPPVIFPNFSFLKLPNLVRPEINGPKINFRPIKPRVLSNNRHDNYRVSPNALVNGAMKYWGYNESDGSCKLFGGSKSIAWCCLFTTYVARENGSNVPHFAAVYDLFKWGQKNNRFHRANPQIGDALILRGPTGNRETGRSHVGIVDYVDPKTGKVRIIAGNSGKKDCGRVKHEWYSLNDPSITGYVTLT